ncbi:MAG: hypothetical protein SFU53_15375 [Terrimicrobiaceae bacterium]|nr:hypothetical protein [Terrimicrobiaceae bacterium]
MAALRLILLALVLAGPAWLNAEEQIAFAIPDEGLVTLGVFDDRGKLVRRLHELTPEADFKKGLNGLITTWDGTDDSGHRLPAGSYHVRGYLIGDVEVHGERFHFNDWITETTDPEIRRIEDFHLLPELEVILIAQKADGTKAAMRYSPEGGFRWIQILPSEAGPSGVDGESVHVAAGGNILRFSLADGQPGASVSIGEGSPVSAMAGSAGGIEIARGSAVFRVGPEGLDAGTATPVIFSALGSAGGNLSGCGDGRLFLRRGEGEFVPVQVPGSVQSVAFGTGDSLWFVAGDGSGTFVGQTSFSGELLRALKPEAGEPAPGLIRASTTNEVFAVLEDGPGVQRLRVMARDETTGWTVEWERSSGMKAQFGFRDGDVVGDATDAPAEVVFRAEPDPLAGGQPILRLHVAVGPRGARVETNDGLPIARISTRSDLGRAVMIRGAEPDSARILIGEPTAVAEFAVRGLRHIRPLDVGSIELGEENPGKSQGAD